jgi:hypothetical protein
MFSVYHQAKIVRKTLILTVLRLLIDFLSLKNYVNVPSRSNKQNNLKKKLVFCWRQNPDPLPDPDPQKNVMDKQHCASAGDPNSTVDPEPESGSRQEK